MENVTQDMKFRPSLMNFAEKYGVSRKFDKSRSYIYFWLKRYDGTMESLACLSRRPPSHPNQHTEALIRDMHHRNPNLGIVELLARMRKLSYLNMWTNDAEQFLKFALTKPSVSPPL